MKTSKYMTKYLSITNSLLVYIITTSDQRGGSTAALARKSQGQLGKKRETNQLLVFLLGGQQGRRVLPELPARPHQVTLLRIAAPVRPSVRPSGPTPKLTARGRKGPPACPSVHGVRSLQSLFSGPSADLTCPALPPSLPPSRCGP